MDFWSWALNAYARPGCAEACLDLQDRHGQNVPYLLWAAWAAAQGRNPTPEGLSAAAALAARWDAAAVGPIRATRRALKPSMPGMADDVREGLRGEVKALELKAERILMAALEALAPAPAGASLPIAGALMAASEAWSAPAPAGALDRLANTLC